MSAAAGAGPRPRAAWGAILPALLVGAAALLLFLPARGFDFLNYDDNEYVTQNPAVQGGLTGEAVRWAFSEPRFDYWIPLTWLSHMLDVELYGLEPAGHHLTGIMLHALNAALAYAALFALTGARWRSFLAAALFALHPLRVESVAWVTERKDVLSALFGLLALLAYTRYARGRGRGRATLALCTVLLAASLMAKPMLVTFPLLALVLDLWPLGRLGRAGAGGAAGAGRRERLRGLLAEKAPLFAVAAIAGGLAVFTQRPLYTVVEVPLLQRAAVALVSPVDYLAKTLWPSALAIVYPPRRLPIPAGELLLAVALLGGVTALAVAGLRRRPFLAAGWLWFLVCLAPVSGFFQAGMIALADRFTYLPHLGLAVAFSWGAAALAAAGRRRSLVVAAGCAATVALLAAGTARQLPYWRDSRTLFTRAVAVTGDNPVAYNNLAAAYADDGETTEAARLLQEALQFAPGNALIRNNLGVNLLREGRPVEAEAQFREALAFHPGREIFQLNFGMALAAQGRGSEASSVLETAVREHPASAGARAALGAVLLQAGNAVAAVEQLSAAVRMDPGVAEAHSNLGSAYLALGRLEAAFASYREALRIRPAYAGGRYNLALALARGGRFAEAVPEFERVLASLAGGAGPVSAGIPLSATPPGPDPARVAADFADAYNNHGVALMNQARVAEAERSYREAVRLAPEHAAAFNNLGNALVNQGRAEESLAMYRAAIANDPGMAAAHHNLAAALEGLGRTRAATAARDRARALEEPR